MLAMFGDVQRFGAGGLVDGLACDIDVEHPVYAVAGGILVLVVVAKEIVVVVHEHHRNGVDDVARSVLAQFAFTVYIQVEVEEGDLLLERMPSSIVPML